MELLGVIFSIVLGTAFIAVAVAHEYTWWRRRKWSLGKGVVVGYTTQRSADGDGYFPEIEFEGGDGAVRFVSEYGDGSKPTLGTPVKLFIDEKRESAEVISMGTRFLFTLLPMVMGLIFMWVGLNLKPLPPEAHDTAPCVPHQPPPTRTIRHQTVVRCLNHPSSHPAS